MVLNLFRYILLLPNQNGRGSTMTTNAISLYAISTYTNASYNCTFLAENVKKYKILYCKMIFLKSFFMIQHSIFYIRTCFNLPA